MTDELKETNATPQDEAASTKPSSSEAPTSNKKFLIISIIVIIIVLALVVLATIFLVNPSNSQTTEQIRDVFIIFMALEFSDHRCCIGRPDRAIINFDQFIAK